MSTLAYCEAGESKELLQDLEQVRVSGGVANLHIHDFAYMK